MGIVGRFDGADVRFGRIETALAELEEGQA